MLIYGHRFIKSEFFFHILDIDSIANTPPSSTIFIEFDENNLDIIEYMLLNKISMALGVEDVTQLVYASSFGASFIIIPKDLALVAQNIANNYLFDAKILVRIENEDEIEDLAILGVDGAIFPNAIIKINS